MKTKREWRMRPHQIRLKKDASLRWVAGWDYGGFGIREVIPVTGNSFFKITHLQSGWGAGELDTFTEARIFVEAIAGFKEWGSITYKPNGEPESWSPVLASRVTRAIKTVEKRFKARLDREFDGLPGEPLPQEPA